MTSENSSPPTPQTSLWSRLVFFFHVFQMRMRFILIFVLAGLVVAYWERIDAWYDRLTRPAVVPLEKGAEAFEYRCPMHPQVVRDHPANCPICGMPLSRRPKGQPVELAAGSLGRIQLTPYKMQLGNVAVSEVRPLFLVRELRQYGDIESDQTRMVDVTAKVRGRIEELLVNYDGAPVQAGQVLFRQFSEDLFRAQQEYLITLNEEQDRQRKRELLHPPPGGTLVDAAKRRLLDYGFSPEQIEELTRTKTPELITPIRSPINGFVLMRDALQGQYTKEGDSFYQIADLSKVWLQIRVFEDQLENVKPGTAVEVHAAAYPQETFIGKVIFIAPMVDPVTRTVAARVEIDNPGYRLRPGMYAEAVIRTPAGKVEALGKTEEKNAETPKRQNAETQPSVLRPPSSAPQSQSAPSAVLIPASLLDAYLTLCRSLAADKSDPAAIHKLSQAAQTLPPKGFTELKEAIQVLHQANGLEPTRQALGDVSGYLISALDKTGQLAPYYVVYCSMKPGSWLQTEEQVNNPYFGSGMLRCGDITHKPEKKKDEGGRMKDETQFPSSSSPASSFIPHPSALPLTGYYCPLTPDRVFDHPGECPIEHAPMIYAKLEPVLAIPESAVIDTGNRKFVYVEADPAAWGPGVFDLVDVKLAPAAKGEGGLYYPVLGGLKAGERVVTRGTFAVDAENRLSGSYPQ